MIRVAVVASLFAFGCGHRPPTKADPGRHVDVNRAIDESQRKTDERPHSVSTDEKVDAQGSQTPATAQPPPSSPPPKTP